MWHQSVRLKPKQKSDVRKQRKNVIVEWQVPQVFTPLREVKHLFPLLKNIIPVPRHLQILMVLKPGELKFESDRKSNFQEAAKFKRKLSAWHAPRPLQGPSLTSLSVETTLRSWQKYLILLSVKSKMPTS